jgi:hypothetical protein
MAGILYPEQEPGVLASTVNPLLLRQVQAQRAANPRPNVTDFMGYGNNWGEYGQNLVKNLSANLPQEGEDSSQFINKMIGFLGLGGMAKVRGILEKPAGIIGTKPMPKKPVAEYRGQHSAPGADSAPAFDLTGNSVYPKDVYDMPHWYESDLGLEEMRKIQRLRGNPDAPVWIYRAVPKDVYDEAMERGLKEGVSPLSLLLKDGDWVTTSKQYAKDHGASALKGEYQIVSRRVKAKDIHTNGDSIFEWGYNPKGSE